jgi:exonuclease VII large subunit
VRTLLADALTRVGEKAGEADRGLQALRDVLAQLNPQTVLARGYALIRGSQKVGETIVIETNQTIINAEVRDVKNK